MRAASTRKDDSSPGNRGRSVCPNALIPRLDRQKNRAAIALDQDCNRLARGQIPGTLVKVIHRGHAAIVQHADHIAFAYPRCAGRTIILCTDLDVDIADLSFASYQIELLGKMLGAADLMAQLADPRYLEKLQFLYREFRESGMGNYESELDIFQNAVFFYDIFDQP